MSNTAIAWILGVICFIVCCLGSMTIWWAFQIANMKIPTIPPIRKEAQDA